MIRTRSSKLFIITIYELYLVFHLAFSPDNTNYLAIYSGVGRILALTERSNGKASENEKYQNLLQITDIFHATLTTNYI